MTAKEIFAFIAEVGIVPVVRTATLRAIQAVEAIMPAECAPPKSP